MPQVIGRRQLSWLWQFLGGASGAQDKSYTIADIVNPVVDIDTNWPLDVRIEPDLGFATNAAAITARTYGPAVGKHRMYLAMTMAMTNRSVNDVATLFIARPGGTNYQTLLTQQCFTTLPFQLVGGGYLSYDVAGGLPPQVGCKPIYVAYPNSLVLSINRVAGVNGTTDVQLSFMELDLTTPIPRFLFGS